VIIFNNHDFKFAQEQAAKVSENCSFIFRANGAKEMKCILKLQILFGTSGMAGFSSDP
jgi:hypothetical protein